MDRTKQASSTKIRNIYSIAIRQKRSLTVIDYSIQNYPEGKEHDAGRNKLRDKYYAHEEQLKESLRQLLSLDFTLLPKTALIRFLIMCNSHRPDSPVGIMVRLAMHWEEKDPYYPRASDHAPKDAVQA
jgi:hypothetical protein